MGREYTKKTQDEPSSHFCLILIVIGGLPHRDSDNAARPEAEDESSYKGARRFMRNMRNPSCIPSEGANA
jgi:hypothetical protein